MSFDLPAIAAKIGQIHSEIYEATREAQSQAVHSDRHGLLVLKQRPDFHSFSVVVHGRVTGGVMEHLLDWRLATNPQDPYIFTSPSVNGLVTINPDPDDVEANQRHEILDLAKKLVTQLNLDAVEKRILTIGAYLHDIGKVLEPFIKDMENIGGPDRPVLRIRRDEDGQRLVIPNPYHNDAIGQGGSSFDAAHHQDALLVQLYSSFGEDRVVDQSTVDTLIGTHTIFTQLSQLRNTGSANDWNNIAKQMGESAFAKGLLLLVADEIAKGRKFLDSPDAPDKRIQKNEKMIIMLRELVREEP